MSLRYIAPVLSLSMSSFLCGTDHAENPFGSPVISENASFGSALAAGKSGSFRMQAGELSRQASGILGEELTTPLAVRDPNKPVSRAGTPCAKPQSDTLKEYRLEFENSESTARQRIELEAEFSFRGEPIMRQYLAEQHRNRIIEQARLDIILTPDALDKEYCKSLTSSPLNWADLPLGLKQCLIEISPLYYNTEDGWFHILEDWISLDYFLFLVKPVFVQKGRVAKGSEEEKNRPSRGMRKMGSTDRF